MHLGAHWVGHGHQGQHPQSLVGDRTAHSAPCPVASEANTAQCGAVKGRKVQRQHTVVVGFQETPPLLRHHSRDPVQHCCQDRALPVESSLVCAVWDPAREHGQVDPLQVAFAEGVPALALQGVQTPPPDLPAPPLQGGFRLPQMAAAADELRLKVVRARKCRRSEHAQSGCVTLSCKSKDLQSLQPGSPTKQLQGHMLKRSCGRHQLLVIVKVCADAHLWSGLFDWRGR